jgi:hypothetical protein
MACDYGVRRNYELSCLDKEKEAKIHVEVCRRKCKSMQECKSYKEYVINLEKKAA